MGSEEEKLTEIKEASGSYDFQHAKLLPGWSQILDPETGKNVYVNESTNERTFDKSVATGMNVQVPSTESHQMTDEQKVDTLKKAKQSGIGGPILNKDAAIAMSFLNANHDDTRRLPLTLVEEINQFKFEDFSRRFFSTHKKGIIIKKKVPLEDQMCWTKEKLPGPLMTMNKENVKVAVKSFKILQKGMKDRGTVKGNPASCFETLIECGVHRGEMRDELYVQLCKQLNKNPNPESVILGWQLMAAYVVSFPPSKNFENYLISFFRSYPREDSKVNTIVEYSEKKLNRISKTGPRGKAPNLAELERAMEAPFSPSVFGETLEDVMKMQNENDGDIPNVLSYLAVAVLKLNGQKSEGIFRVPGDTEQVTELKLRIERGQYSIKKNTNNFQELINNYDSIELTGMEGIEDPMVPASLLKYWLRELVNPLIPNEIYSDAIQHAQDEKEVLSILEKVDPLHQKVIHFLIAFLQKIAEPENQPFTKMTISNLGMVFAPSFLRCPSDNPQTIFENSKVEQDFVKTLLLHLKSEPST